ncbi:MAG: hypothetical protein ABI413_09070 [Ktedonobacteraceae bacterium]
MDVQQRKEIQKKYGWFYETFVQLLANYDFMSLVKSGAPSDEYENEAAMILIRIHEADSPDSLAYLMYEIFTKAFSTNPVQHPTEQEKQLYKNASQRYKNAGQAVWDTWKRWELEANPSLSIQYE